MNRLSLLVLLCMSASGPALAQGTTIAPSSQARAEVPLAALADRLRLQHETFTLANGLRVIVHTDRKAPLVSVGVWYDVGSSDEPARKTGFAHLFEHLMFNGSEHANGDWFEPLQSVGATNMNGSTSYDQTNYYETVPNAALERTLFLESDRMGYLLGAVTQAKVDAQRGVVQNEKRQGDGKPFGLVDYVKTKALFPADHPYGHPIIGSMEDLDAASLDDVRGWFRDHYAPNNAVIALSGDIDGPTARRLMEKYFGSFRPGPRARPVAAPLPTLAAPVARVMHDDVSATRLYRFWAVPGEAQTDAVPLSVGAAVLGGLASSRLADALVRREKLATEVAAQVDGNVRAGVFTVVMEVKPGVDPVVAGKRLDALIAELVATGPTPAEVKLVAIGQAGGQVRSLESSSAAGFTLAAGLLRSGDADQYRKDLERYATMRPAEVRAAMQRWLRRPVFALTVAPGKRENLAEVAIRSSFAPVTPAAIAAVRNPMDRTRATAAARPVVMPTLPVDVSRAQLPPVGTLADLTFPDVVTRRLSNGIEVRYAHRGAVPLTQMMLSFDAGFAADPRDRLGLAALTASLLGEGTDRMDASAFAKRQEELGTQISASAQLDRTAISMSALSTMLVPSLDLLSDIVQRPAFAPAEVERLRQAQLARIGTEIDTPLARVDRTLVPLLYGNAHPYGIPNTGSGTRETVAAISRDDIITYRDRWLQPGTARLYVVSDLTPEQLLPMLEARFGTWRARIPAGVKTFPATVPVPRPRILLSDRPGAPQSLIVGGQVLGLRGRDNTLALGLANGILGGDFLSRINTDLRETKGWSYGSQSGFTDRVDRLLYRVSVPVQADKTGAALAALRSDMNDFLTTKGVTPKELASTTQSYIRELPGSLEESASVLSVMARNDLRSRSIDYQASLPAKWRAQTTESVNRAARDAIDPEAFTWMIVGDAAVVGPQLQELGLPVEVVSTQ